MMKEAQMIYMENKQLRLMNETYEYQIKMLSDKAQKVDQIEKAE